MTKDKKPISLNEKQDYKPLYIAIAVTLTVIAIIALYYLQDKPKEPYYFDGIDTGIRYALAHFLR